ncbi:MAG: hypothetical protein HC881_23670 [Leptolyngbyaceae cyanobacterium SL_7_1]|nr:hypothetical protein [Leptolyngbyaceae cyanobacterium SL_7_1]
MNNGKVRIYELSRELNLDNRDILAVCDQLNISVKSHSSTISDVEAARIRSAAEKYTPSYSGKTSVSTQSSNSQQPRKSTSPPPIKKQQILEVRRNRPLTEPPRRPEVEAIPPRSVASPEVARVSPPSYPPQSPDIADEAEVIESIAEDTTVAESLSPLELPVAEPIADSTEAPVQIVERPVKPSAKVDAATLALLRHDQNEPHLPPVEEPIVLSSNVRSRKPKGNPLRLSLALLLQSGMLKRVAQV